MGPTLENEINFFLDTMARAVGRGVVLSRCAEIAMIALLASSSHDDLQGVRYDREVIDYLFP